MLFFYIFDCHAISAPPHHLVDYIHNVNVKEAHSEGCAVCANVSGACAPLHRRCIRCKDKCPGVHMKKAAKKVSEAKLPNYGPQVY